MKIKTIIPALALALVAVLFGVSSAQAYIQPVGLWTETTFTAPPALSHNTECYKVTSTNYVCETAVGGNWDFPGDNWYASTHQVVHTTQRFGGDDTWVCFNHGRVGVNSSFTCFNPADY